MVSGDTLKIRDVCMDFEPYFKVHNLVSVYPRSIILSQITNLNMIFHVVVSVYRLVKFETRPSSPMNFGMANRCAIFLTLYPSMQMSVFPKLTNQECLLQYTCTICKSMRCSSAAIKGVHFKRNWKLMGVVKNVLDKKVMP